MNFEEYRNKPVPWGPLGYIVYKRTYSRGGEEWWQTLSRCVNALIDMGYGKEDAKILYDYLFNFKCSLSGRALWQLGSGTVARLGGDSLQNCWCVAADDLSAFPFMFNQLMLGGGVGMNITYEKVYKLPPVRFNPKVTRVVGNDVDFIVPDNREGWVELLRKILECFFVTGKDFTYSTNCIRAKGLPISTFGGTASGSEELVVGLGQIVGILKRRHGRQLNPIDCGDIANIIGKIVVAGNVRRSAEILIGSPHDTDFLSAKNWNQNNVPGWRGASNNTIAVNGYSDIVPEFWEGYLGNGEPYGIINLENCLTYGRMADGQFYRTDNLVIGTNPCGEITLENREPCNLGEIFLPNIHNIDEFRIASQLLLQACKLITTLPYSDPITSSVVSRNRRVGISVSGLLQSKWHYDSASFTDVYECLMDYDRLLSKRLGINESIKLTTVKPSGTLSLLAGVTPGLHAAYAPFYIRRVRMASDDSLVRTCYDAGYHVEPVVGIDGKQDLGTMVVSFPIRTPLGTILASDLSAVDQLNNLMFMQHYWSDNSVSATIYYAKEELQDIKNWLEENLDDIKSVSFLLHEGHGFKQAPMEEIDEATYEDLKSKTKPLGFVGVGEQVGDFECAGGTCPIK